MARLVTSGAEFQAATTVLNQAEGQGYICTGPPTIETTVVRSGAAAWKSTGSTQHTRWDTVTNDGRDYFIRAYFRWPAAPSVAQRIITANPGAQGYAQTIAGTTQVALYDDANAQVGSASAALALDTWHRIEMVIGITSGRLKLYVNGTLIAGVDSGADLGATITSFTIGNNSTGTDTVYWDDVAINDSTGGVDDGLSGPGKIILRLAASDFQRDTNWLAAGDGTTNLFAEVDNTPPTGIFTPANLIKNLASTTTETYTAETGSYSAGGIAAADRIKVVQAVAVIADNVAAATRSAGLNLDANPSDTEVTATTPAGVASTYPVGFITMRGTLTSSPSVTLGSPLRVKVRKNSANADPLYVALLGAYVEYAEQLVDSEADSVSATDVQTAEAGLVKADTATVTDASATEAGAAKADSVSASDQVSVEPGLAEADSVSVSDSLSLEAGPGVADSVTATDALVAEGQAVTSDTATVTDAVAVEVEATQADSVTVSEFLGAELFTEQVAADSVTVTDAHALHVEVAIDDSVMATDAVVSVPPPGAVTDTGGGWAMPPKLPLRLAHELSLVDLVVASDHLEAEFQLGSLDHRLPLTDTVVVDDRWKLELELDADFQLEEELILALL